MGALGRISGAGALVLGTATGAWACQPTVTVQAGESLFSIAEDELGDISLWSQIFYSNPDVQGGSLLDIVPGTVLTIPCPGAPAQRPAPAPAPRAVVEPAPAPQVQPSPPALRGQGGEIQLLARADFPPFTDQRWPASGMLNELVEAAFEDSPYPITRSTTWEKDWGRHLFPLLDSKAFDMGFPWAKPDCAAMPDDATCAAFHFSDPLVDVVVLLFVRVDASLPFEVDSDLHGRVLCRPAGYFTHDLDRADRQWLTRGLVRLEQPATAEDCFEMLMAGEVDAVTLNEFLGVQKMFELDLTADVTPLPRPVSVEGLHVVISKSHWRGTAHMHRFNAGLARLRQSTRYNEIISRHLAQFWDQIKS